MLVVAALGAALISVSLIGRLRYPHLVSGPNSYPHPFFLLVAALLVASPLLAWLVAVSLHRARARSSRIATDAEGERGHLDTAIDAIPTGLAMFDRDKPLPASEVMQFCHANASSGRVVLPDRTSGSASSVERERRRRQTMLARPRGNRPRG